MYILATVWMPPLTEKVRSAWKVFDLDGEVNFTPLDRPPDRRLSAICEPLVTVWPLTDSVRPEPLCATVTVEPLAIVLPAQA